MAAVILESNPALVTSTGTANTEIEFDQTLFGNLLESVNIAYIEVVSGTFNFNVGATASSLSGSYTDGDKIILTFGAGKKISYKAAAGSQTFKISF